MARCHMGKSTSWSPAPEREASRLDIHVELAGRLARRLLAPRRLRFRRRQHRRQCGNHLLRHLTSKRLALRRRYAGLAVEKALQRIREAFDLTQSLADTAHE